MSPLQVLLILWRRSWIFILTFAAVVLGASAVLWVIPPRYDAVATATIDPGQTDPVTGQQVGGSSMRLLQGNLVNLAKSHRVAHMVVKRLNLVANPGLVAQFRASDAIGRVDVTDWMALEVLRKSYVKGTVEPGNDADEWKVKLVEQMKGTGREVGVVVSVVGGTRLRVITVEWEDVR